MSSENRRESTKCWCSVLKMSIPSGEVPVRPKKGHSGVRRALRHSRTGNHSTRTPVGEIDGCAPAAQQILYDMVLYMSVAVRHEAVWGPSAGQPRQRVAPSTLPIDEASDPA
jgi:hypothetical protein